LGDSGAIPRLNALDPLVNQSEISIYFLRMQHNRLVSFLKKRRVLAPNPPAADQEPATADDS